MSRLSQGISRQVTDPGDCSIPILRPNVENKTICPQHPVIRLDHLKTFNNFQKLLGDINWLCPTLRITTGQLGALFDILKGDPDPASSRILTPKARGALILVELAIHKAVPHRVNPNEGITLLIFPSKDTSMGMLWKSKGIVEWMHLSHSTAKTITTYPEAIATLISKGRYRCKQLLGSEPATIVVP